MIQSKSAYCAVAVGAFCFLLATQTAISSPPHPVAYQMLNAARWWIDASRLIHQSKLDAGLEITEADSAETGLIGIEYSPITTTLGSLKSKQISANPDFAALMVRWLWSVGVREGDTVAVSLTGSFPALNLAAFAAIQTLNLHAVTVSSLGASSWGANQPEMTWVDMERLLMDNGLIINGSDAITMGGGGDRGGGLPLEGQEILMRKIQESGILFLDPKSLIQAIGMKLTFYGNLDQYKCFINIGGGQAALGRGPGGRTLPTGLLRTFPEDGPFESGEVDGVIFYFLRQGIPVIHLLEIHRIARRWGITTSPKSFTQPGKSPVYFLEE